MHSLSDRAFRALEKSRRHQQYIIEHPGVLETLDIEELHRGFRACQKLEKAVADIRTDLRTSRLRSDVVSRLVRAVAGFCAVPRRSK
jgi:hypothetical protein